MTLNPPAV